MKTRATSGADDLDGLHHVAATREPVAPHAVVLDHQVLERSGAREPGSPNARRVVENEPTIDKRLQSMKTDKADALASLRVAPRSPDLNRRRHDESAWESSLERIDDA